MNVIAFKTISQIQDPTIYYNMLWKRIEQRNGEYYLSVGANGKHVFKRLYKNPSMGMQRITVEYCQKPSGSNNGGVGFTYRWVPFFSQCHDDYDLKFPEEEG